MIFEKSVLIIGKGGQLINRKKKKEIIENVESMEKEWEYLASYYSSEHELEDSQISCYEMNETKISSIPFWIKRQKSLDASTVSYKEIDKDTLNKNKKCI